MRGEHFSPDIRDLLRVFAKYQVRFLLVGGEAVIYHGYARLTGDVDLFYDQASENCTRLFTALHEFWEGNIPGLHTETELREPNVVVQFGTPPHRVDLLSAIDGVTFNDAWANRIDETLDLSDGSRVSMSVIGLRELLRNKRASGRYKDLDDVQRLDPSRC